MAKQEIILSSSQQEKYDPNQNIFVDCQPLPGCFGIYVDSENHLLGTLSNYLLETLNSNKRARAIYYEDGYITSGIWTPEEAVDVSQRIVLGPDGNLHDPLESLGQKTYDKLSNLVFRMHPFLVPPLIAIMDAIEKRKK